MTTKDLPEGWHWRELGEVANFINGRAFKPSDWGTEGLPIVRIQNLTDPNKPFNYYNGDYEPRHFIQNGDILVSWSASLGVFKWGRGDALLNQHIFKVEPHNELINKDFFAYVIQTKIDEMKHRVHGSTMKHITKGLFLSLKIPLPPLETQRRIVEILERADALRRKRQEADEKTSQILQAAFVKMFGDPVRNEMGWDTDIIDNHTSIKVTKGSTPTTYGYKWEDEGVLFLRSECITPDEVSLTGSMYISQEAHDSMKRSKVFPGDILIRITGEVGISAIFPEYLKEANINQHIAIVRLEENCSLDPLFLMNQLNTQDFRNHFVSITRGVTHPHLSLQQIRETKIIVPPLELQQQFARLVERVETMRERQTKSKEQINEMFQGLMQKAFRGELVA
jgi:type I restriction enzyme S subunit